MHLICLHNVIADQTDAYDEKCSRISIDEFEQFLDEVSRRFTLVSYSVYSEMLEGGHDDPDCVSLSFDDGFLGVYAHAFPALEARNIDAVAFINPPFVGNPPNHLFHFLEIEIAFRLSPRSELKLTISDECFDLRTDRSRIKAMKAVKKLLKTSPEAIRSTVHEELLEKLDVSREVVHRYAHTDPKFQIMGRSNLRALRSANWIIGSHAMSHRTLSMLSRSEAEAEIREARDYFQSEFGWYELPFAYPYGDRVHVGTCPPAICAEAGHPIAYTTVPGPSDFTREPHLMPRIDYKRFVRDFDLSRVS